MPSCSATANLLLFKWISLRDAPEGTELVVEFRLVRLIPVKPAWAKDSFKTNVSLKLCYFWFMFLGHTPDTNRNSTPSKITVVLVLVPHNRTPEISRNRVNVFVYSNNNNIIHNKKLAWDQVSQGMVEGWY